MITLDDLEYSYPDDGDQCYYCGRKWASDSPWEFFYLDNHLLCVQWGRDTDRAFASQLFTALGAIQIENQARI